MPEAGLTSRELEIALLAAKGMQSKEIARMLYISKRTVHAHLRKVYVKAGVKNRTQLLNWLSAQPPGDPS
jgi:DNA-binding CsgD family transcriptional regulator